MPNVKIERNNDACRMGRLRPVDFISTYQVGNPDAFFFRIFSEEFVNIVTCCRFWLPVPEGNIDFMITFVELELRTRDPEAIYQLYVNMRKQSRRSAAR